MLTPCIYKRAIIWLLFFVLSFIIVPFFGEDEPAPQQPMTNRVQSK
jgi:hypothetical protein